MDPRPPAASRLQAVLGATMFAVFPLSFGWATLRAAEESRPARAR